MSIVGFFPYTCRACNSRSLRFAHSFPAHRPSANPTAEREIAATRAALGRRRKQREILVYCLALLVFAAVLYFLTRVPSTGA